MHYYKNMLRTILKYIAETELLLMDAPRSATVIAVAVLMALTSVFSVVAFIILSAIARLLL